MVVGASPEAGELQVAHSRDGLTLALTSHPATGEPFWCFRATRPANALAYLEYAPQSARARGAVTVRFLDERYTGRVPSGAAFVAHLTPQWWGEAMPPDGLTFQEFKASPVHTLGFSVAMVTGLLPRDVSVGDADE